MKRLQTIMIAMIVFLYNNAFAEEYILSIQPIIPKDEVITSYQPLADYLSENIGHKITIKTYSNFFTYWQSMKNKKNFDLVLDAAHFTDYRIQNNNYTVLAKFPDTIRFSLVTHSDSSISKTDDLILKPVATSPSPGLGGIRLYEIFNNPSRLPKEITVSDIREAIDAVADGDVDAAIIPSFMVSKYKFLKVITTTKATPNIALSVSPAVPTDFKKNILNALINADKSFEGRSMLKRIGLPKFADTSDTKYSGYSQLLEGMFGYQPSVKLKMAVSE